MNKGVKAEAKQQHVTKQPKIPKQKVQGTSGDLRKMPIQDAQALLIKFGDKWEDIKHLQRWELIARVRDKSTEAANVGNHEVAKFARRITRASEAKTEKYEQECQFIFENQIRALSKTAAEIEQEERDEKEFQEQLESELVATSSKSSRHTHSPTNYTIDPDEDSRDFELFMQETQERSKHKQDQDTVAGKRKYLKRTIIYYENGVEHTRTEKISDPHLVELALQKRKKASMGLNRKRVVLSVQQEMEQLEFKKQKRRLQEKKRRLQKQETKAKEYINAIKHGEQPAKPKLTAQNIHCTVCGQEGHIKTNTSCPGYIKRESAGKQRQATTPRQAGPTSPMSPEGGFVDRSPQVDGTKVVLPSKLNTKNGGNFSKRDTRKRKSSGQDDTDMNETSYIPSGKDTKRLCGKGLETYLMRAWTAVKEYCAAKSGIIFDRPVNVDSVKDYLSIVEKPMDLSAIANKIKDHKYHSRYQVILYFFLKLMNSFWTI